MNPLVRGGQGGSPLTRGSPSIITVQHKHRKSKLYSTEDSTQLGVQELTLDAAGFVQNPNQYSLIK